MWARAWCPPSGRRPDTAGPGQPPARLRPGRDWGRLFPDLESPTVVAEPVRRPERPPTGPRRRRLDPAISSDLQEGRMRFSEAAPAVEQDGDRPIVDELNAHVGLKFA